MQKVYLFRQQLDDELKGELGYREPQTLTDAIEIAQKYEIHKKARKQEANINQMHNSRDRIKFCSFCNRNGHWTNECFKKNKLNLSNKDRNRASMTHNKINPNAFKSNGANNNNYNSNHVKLQNKSNNNHDASTKSGAFYCLRDACAR